MKRILFLIVCLISFSAKADMQLLWEQENTDDLRTNVLAYCVFADTTYDEGSVYLYTYSFQGMNRALISVNPLLVANITGVGGTMLCKRQS